MLTTWPLYPTDFFLLKSSALLLLISFQLLQSVIKTNLFILTKVLKFVEPLCYFLCNFLCCKVYSAGILKHSAKMISFLSLQLSIFVNMKTTSYLYSFVQL